MDKDPVNYDVAVVGGGAAGLAAALGAARHGARTALIERHGFLGGMATAGMVGTICGLYLTSASGQRELLNGGFAEIFAMRLSNMAGCGSPIRQGRTFVLPYTPMAFACLADELANSAPNLNLYLHSYLVGVETAKKRIEALRVATWERHFELRAQTFVDTSGDAMVAYLAGAATEMEPAAVRQLPSLVFVLQNVDTEVLGSGPRTAILRALLAAELEGRLPKGTSNLVLRPSPQPGEVICKLTLNGLAEKISADNDFLTVAEQEGRRRAVAVVEFLKHLPAFAKAFISHTAPQVGVRETRRVIGRYQLSREDILSGRRFEDAVARASWPIELWEEGCLGAAYEYLESGQTYTIPLRCLQSMDMDNLFMAGRCMSASHAALGSTRVIGTCLAVGEAVGKAAARQAA